MLERLKDRVADIRSQAVTALMRLQDPKDENCPIIKVRFYCSCYQDFIALPLLNLLVVVPSRIINEIKTFLDFCEASLRRRTIGGGRLC